MDKTAPLDLPEPDDAPTTAAPPARRRRTRPGPVLLTGVGGIIGQALIKCLANTPWRPIGADSSEMAAGLYAVSKGYVVPKTTDPAYIDRLLKICAAEGASYIFFGLDMELPVASRAVPRFLDAGVTPILSGPDVIAIGDDKLHTIRFLESHGLPVPLTYDIKDGRRREVGFPMILKPRRGGSRSQGVMLVRDEHELEARLGMVDASNYVAQEYIEGDEYSCGSITFDGVCHGVAVMQRTLRDGDTHKAHVLRHPAIEDHVRRAAEALKPFGPCNFQLRLRGGVPFIFEINPRCSGGSYIRALAGFNEPLMTLNFVEHGTRPAFQIRPMSVFRYWNEIVVDSRKVAETRRGGVVQNGNPGL